MDEAEHAPGRVADAAAARRARRQEIARALLDPLEVLLGASRTVGQVGLAQVLHRHEDRVGVEAAPRRGGRGRERSSRIGHSASRMLTDRARGRCAGGTRRRVEELRQQPRVVQSRTSWRFAARAGHEALGDLAHQFVEAALVQEERPRGSPGYGDLAKSPAKASAERALASRPDCAHGARPSSAPTTCRSTSRSGRRAHPTRRARGPGERAERRLAVELGLDAFADLGRRLAGIACPRWAQCRSQGRRRLGR